MAESLKCPECGAKYFDENATFCRHCLSTIRAAKSRWMIPE